MTALPAAPSAARLLPPLASPPPSPPPPLPIGGVEAAAAEVGAAVEHLGGELLEEAARARVAVERRARAIMRRIPGARQALPRVHRGFFEVMS